VDLPLWICGDGNFMAQARELVHSHGLENKVLFKGMIAPAALRTITDEAYIGITLFEQTGQSNYYSLANRFFDYMQSVVPQLCVDYPVYREINNSMEIAVLIWDLSPESIAGKLNGLIHDPKRWETLHENCLRASAILNWEEEEKKLIQFYKNIFG
jgi:glycosyltransferase involved in cell wall biosynthesis